MQNGVGSERKEERNRRKKCGEVIKKGREEEERKNGREEEERKEGEKKERRVYLNPEGHGLSCFEEEF